MTDCSHSMPLGQCSLCSGLTEVPEPGWERKDYVLTLAGVIDHEALLVSEQDAARKEELRKLFDDAYKEAM